MTSFRREMSENEAKQVEAMIDRLLVAKTAKSKMVYEIDQLSIEISPSQYLEPNALQPTDLLQKRERFPRFETTISHIDASGGGYGLTICAARAGAGKSTLTIAAAIRNAQLGIPVIIFDAENDAELTARRMLRCLGENGESQLYELMKVGLLNWIEVETGACIRAISKAVIEHLGESGALVAFDSINSISKRIAKPRRKWDPGETYFESISNRCDWMRRVAKNTSGRIRFLALSELNKDGAVKGLEAEHIASVVIRLDREEDQPDGVIRVSVTKNRDGKEDRKGLLYVRDWKTNSFQRKDDEYLFRA